MPHANDGKLAYRHEPDDVDKHGKLMWSAAYIPGGQLDRIACFKRHVYFKQTIRASFVNGGPDFPNVFSWYFTEDSVQTNVSSTKDSPRHDGEETTVADIFTNSSTAFPEGESYIRINGDGTAEWYFHQKNTYAPYEETEFRVQFSTVTLRKATADDGTTYLELGQIRDADMDHATWSSGSSDCPKPEGMNILVNGEVLDHDRP